MKQKLLSGAGIVTLSVVTTVGTLLSFSMFEDKCNCHVAEVPKQEPTIKTVPVKVEDFKRVPELADVLPSQSVTSNAEPISGVAKEHVVQLPSKVERPIHPLAKQRRQLRGHKLTRDEKIHFYALALAELGHWGKTEDYAALMETAYNRGITEGDTNITQNLTRAYYEPLRKYRKISYYKTIGKGKKKRRIKRYRTVTTSGYKNYLRYKRQVINNPALFETMDTAHNLVLAGSNFSKLATQNASAGVARSAKKTQTVTHYTSTGETLSRKDKMAYSKAHGYLTIKSTKQWVYRTQKAIDEYESRMEQVQLASN